MKWFKHMVSSYDDEKLSAIIDELGMEGYGFYWRMLEIVAEKLDAKGETYCQFSAKKWGNFFQFSPKKFQKFVRILAEKRLIFVETTEKLIKVDIPNLLKYQDNYQKNLQAANKKVSPRLKNKEEEVDLKEGKPSLCAEPPKATPAPEPEAVAEIPLVDGSEYPITEKHVAEFERAYPAVNVLSELNKIRAWCIANPKRRKTKNGCLRFVNSWLENEQNRGGGTRGNSMQSHVPRATTVAQQRSLERQMMAQMLLDDREMKKDEEKRDAHGSRTVTQPDRPQFALPPGW